MKLIIAGSRTFTNYNLLKKHVDILRNKYNITEIISGCAKGADTLGEIYAELNNIPVKKFPADWDKHGKAAGPIRNKQMAYYGNILIAFKDKENSIGTNNMIQQAEKRFLIVIMIQTWKEDE
jgi:hypothetical protein